MTKRNNESVVTERRDRKAQQGRVIKEKFEEERSARVVPLQAKSEAQRDALKAFTEKQLVVLSGSAGSGKSELMCWWASKLWLEGKIENIVICRPHTSLGTDYGAVTGNDTLKLLPFCMSMMMKFKKYLGYGVLKNSFRMEITEGLFQEAAGISIVPIEKIQGLSFNSKTIILADELQNSTVQQIKALVTRSEEGCQLICAGDNRQSALSGENGLAKLEKVLQYHPHEDATIIRFTPKDNCRSGISGHLANLFEQEGNW